MNKLLLIAIILITVLVITSIHYRNKSVDLEARLQSIPTQQNLSIGKGTTSIGNTTPEVKQLDKQIQQDIKDTKGKVDVVGHAEATNTAKNHGKLIEVPVSNPITPKEIKNASNYLLEFHDFRLNFIGNPITKDAEYSLHQNFELNYAESRLPDGRYNSYAELYELDQNNKRVNKLTLTKFSVVHTNPIEQPKFKFWDPHIDLGVHYLISSNLKFTPLVDIGFSFASRGTSNDIRWRFVRLGIGIDKLGVNLNLSPVMYNFASPLPLVNNMWLTPTIGYTIDNSSYNIGLGISVML